ncbi:hypothetical protein QR680_004743 [Steinernema hermaphroditum]|uniref:Chondroitin proteoglycan 4 domain-containing protein n=1 Tax=Steinernema hermaphroditum TaxID=289476 RepID=A0AA39HRW0_9BILA|nr:hypothetical protein QR680_004743 [Steinernema hermaphroditum]
MNRCSVVVFGLLLLASVDGRSCRSKCTQNLKPEDLNISIYTIANYVKFFEGLDEKCAKLKQARDCVDLCDDEPGRNPYASKAWRIACMESNLDTINSITPCLKEEGDKVKEACREVCGSTDAFDEQESDEDERTSLSRLRMVRLTSSKCSYVKCFLQCSRKEYSKSCPKLEDSDTSVGEFIGNFYDRLIKAAREEMTPLDTVTDFLQRMRILECSFMNNPVEVFDPPVMVGRTGSKVRGIFDTTMDSIQSFLNGFVREFTLR